MNDSGLLWTMDEQKKASQMAAGFSPAWMMGISIQNSEWWWFDDDGIYVYLP